jgi:hypothetical protein
MVNRQQTISKIGLLSGLAPVKTQEAQFLCQVGINTSFIFSFPLKEAQSSTMKLKFLVLILLVQHSSVSEVYVRSNDKSSTMVLQCLLKRFFLHHI